MKTVSHFTSNMDIIKAALLSIKSKRTETKSPDIKTEKSLKEWMKHYGG